MKTLLRSARAKVSIEENVEYELRDAQGNRKALFSDGFLNTLVLSAVRRFYNPYNADGQLKRSNVIENVLTDLALYGVRVNGITGTWGYTRTIANLVPTVGKALAAGRLGASGAPAAVGWTAIGTGAVAAAAGDTALGAEIATNGGARAANTPTLVTTTVTNDTAQFVNTFTFTGSFAITEAGLFNASSVGTLAARQVFSAINVVSGDTLQITWKVSFA